MSEPHDLEAMDRFLAEPRNCIVAGVRSDGRPHLTPNWFLWEEGRFYVSITRSRVKYRVFRNDPRMQIVVDDVMGFRYVIVEGTVEIGEDIDDGLPYFKALRHKHGRTEQGDAELRAEMERDGRVLLMLTPDRPQTEWLTRGF